MKPFKAIGLALVPALGLLTACSDSLKEKPNVLLVVWDTARADRMSLYGHERTTTPFVDQWAREARVFERCTATGNSTVPSHGSIFTGLFPSEHGANNKHKHLDDRHKTLAEILRDKGYDTYLFSANPHISKEENFTQGFQTAEHPWNPKYRKQAVEILKKKMARAGGSGDGPGFLVKDQEGRPAVKAPGELAEIGLLKWLEKRKGGRPYFVFLNYMETHQPFVPPEMYRSRFMTPAQVERSYGLDLSWETIWRFTFGFHDYDEADLEVLSLTYDAAVAELDSLFARLIAALEAGGHLENTVVVLTSDHGEHLGEHHLLDHQYFLYEELLRVPLVIHYPGKMEPGREKLPVVNFDLFPTLLELTGIDPPPGLPERAVSLLAPRAQRLRMAEYPTEFGMPIRKIRDLYPDWDPSRFESQLTALYRGDLKFVWASDGRHALYDLSRDPEERQNLAGTSEGEAKEMEQALRRITKGLHHYDYSKGSNPKLSSQQQERLEALGYSGK